MKKEIFVHQVMPNRYQVTKLINCTDFAIGECVEKKDLDEQLASCMGTAFEIVITIQ